MHLNQFFQTIENIYYPFQKLLIEMNLYFISLKGFCDRNGAQHKIPFHYCSISCVYFQVYSSLHTIEFYLCCAISWNMQLFQELTWKLSGSELLFKDNIRHITHTWLLLIYSDGDPSFSWLLTISKYSDEKLSWLYKCMYKYCRWTCKAHKPIILWIKSILIIDF